MFFFRSESLPSRISSPPSSVDPVNSPNPHQVLLISDQAQRNLAAAGKCKNDSIGLPLCYHEFFSLGIRNQRITKPSNYIWISCFFSSLFAFPPFSGSQCSQSKLRKAKPRGLPVQWNYVITNFRLQRRHEDMFFVLFASLWFWQTLLSSFYLISKYPLLRYCFQTWRQGVHFYSIVKNQISVVLHS